MKIHHVVLALTLSFAPTAALTQTQMDSGQLANSLQGASQLQLSADALRQAALNNIRNQPGKTAVGRQLSFSELNSQAQFTVDIEFDFNSAAIRPKSYRTIGAIADALHNPVLLGYKFIVIGHTDAKGSREYNLKLSEKRAQAVREALINPFGVNPNSLQAVGVGEEQLLDPAHPDAAVNRRVQLINIGR